MPPCREIASLPTELELAGTPEMTCYVDVETVRQHTARLLQSGSYRLAFTPELEAQFERERGPERRERLRREGLVSILAFCAFYLLEWGLTRQISNRELTVQMGLVVPLCLGVNGLMRYQVGRVVREGSVAAMSCVIACMYLVLQNGKGAVAATFTLVGVIVTAMFAAVVMRLRFRYATAACAVIGGAGLLFVAIQRSLDMEQKVTGAALMLIAVGIALMSNHSLEHEERLGYLRNLESEAQRREVARKNAQLERLSAIDKLTGLPNRRSYEERFAQIWAEGQREGTPVSAIVLDIDHFKVVNDVHGHLYGDEVLRRVGLLLPQALRSTEDFAARYGGEEFVVLLPRTERGSAERVAERIRAMVEMAGAPPQARHSRKECRLWVTVSLGVATVYPSIGMVAEELLERADQALYAAKDAGRNRVMFDEVLEETGAGDGDRTRNQRLGKPLLYH